MVKAFSYWKHPVIHPSPGTGAGPGRGAAWGAAGVGPASISAGGDRLARGMPQRQKIGPRSRFLPLKSESAAADAGTPVHTFSGRKQGEMTSDGAEAEERKEWRRRRRLGPTMSKPGSEVPSLSRSEDGESVGYWLPETAASKGRWGAARGSGGSGPESSPMVVRRNDNSG